MPNSDKDTREKIAQRLHEGIATAVDLISSDLAEVIGRRGLTPSSRTALRAIAAKQEKLSMQLRREILLLQGANPQRIQALAKVREVEKLTKKEIEVLHLLAQPLSGLEIAEKLFLSTATVKSHTAGIYRKLGVKNRTAAIAAAYEAGLLLLK